MCILHSERTFGVPEVMKKIKRLTRFKNIDSVDILIAYYEIAKKELMNVVGKFLNE